jgi:hypothetical protein
MNKILGTRIDNDPLLTEEGSVIALELMSLLYSAVLVGNPAPLVREMYEQMQILDIGSRVVVSDAFYRKNLARAWQSTGYLLKIEKIPSDPIYYIQYGPNPEDVVKWSNCRVLRIPTK